MPPRTIIMSKADEDDCNNSFGHSSVGWLSSSSLEGLWEDDTESTGAPLVQTQFPWEEDDRNSAFKRPPPPPPPPASISPNSTPQTTSKQPGTDYELKNARVGLIGSISALINFLKSSGISLPRCVWFERTVSNCLIVLFCSQHILFCPCSFHSFISNPASNNYTRI
jgi:hypothetical protein